MKNTMTLRQLRAILPSTQGKPIPTKEWLKANAKGDAVFYSTRLAYGGLLIVGGKAEPHPVEAPQVKELFELYLDGLSITQAGRLTGIDRSKPTMRHILMNPIYGGSDPYYPALISESDSERAILRASQRALPLTGKSGRRALTPIPVETEFVFSSGSGPVHVDSTTLQSLYDRIVPLRAASPETIKEYMSSLTAPDLLSGAFHFDPTTTILPLKEDSRTAV